MMMTRKRLPAIDKAQLIVPPRTILALVKMNLHLVDNGGEEG